jgi:low molecular weight protein-tyrosine phosphatase
MVAQLLRRIHRSGQGVLHPWRHGQARQMVAACRGTGSILIVCHGNICRSPFAGAVLQRQLAADGVIVESAGFLGPGRGSPANAIEAARIRGYDLTWHRSRLITPTTLARVALVVVMDATQRAKIVHDFGFPRERVLVLGDLEPGPFSGRAIPDPWDRPLEEFVEVYARIERCVGVLATLLSGAVGATRRRRPATLSLIHRTPRPINAVSSTKPGLQSLHLNSS